MSIHKYAYLHAMGIQPWHLNPEKQERCLDIVIINAENNAENVIENQLLEGMLHLFKIEALAIERIDLKRSHPCVLPKSRLFLVLGESTAHFLLKTAESLAQLRGNLYQYNETPLIVTHHPNDLLSNLQNKKNALHDLQFVLRTLN